MDKEYKEWIQEQTFETLATDNYNTKLLLLAEQAKNKKLVEVLEEIIKNHRETEGDIFSLTQPDKGDIFCKFDNTLYIAQQALNEVNNAK